MAPGEQDIARAVPAAHHLLLGHGLAVQALRAAGTRRAGRRGASTSARASRPQPTRPTVAAARRADGHTNRWWLDPLHGRGYPADMVEVYGVEPPVRDGDLATIATPTDHVGLNYYFRQVVTDDPAGPPPYARMVPVPDAVRTDMDWEVHPDGLEQLLTRLAGDYGAPRVFVTENGSAWPDEVVDGHGRATWRAPTTSRRTWPRPTRAVGHGRPAGRLLRLVAAGQLRVGVRVRQAVRAGARRLRHPGADGQGQRPAVREAHLRARGPDHAPPIAEP